MKVSVITVSFNSLNTIERTIHSVLNQTYSDIEHILVDGRSNDGTYQIIQKNINNISKFICEKDNGIYHAMNKGIKASKGDIICILNSDDFFIDKNVITNVVKKFYENKKIDVIFSNIKFFEKINSKFKITRIIKASIMTVNKFRFGWVPPHPGMFVKRDVYKKLGLYNEKYKNAADYDFIIKVFLSKIIKPYYFDKFTVLMQEGGKSNNGILSIVINTKEIIAACLSNGIYTNYFLLSTRIPIKIIQRYIIKIFGNKKNV